VPLLDVTQILTDPDFADKFNVRRRAQTVDAHGRADANEELIVGVIGVVTAISPSDLDRQTDYDGMSRSISVVTKYFLRGETSGYQPDVVVWRGSNYLVKHVDPYPHFGPGFMQAECSSMDKADPPFVNLTSQLDFSQPINSNMVAICS